MSKPIHAVSAPLSGRAYRLPRPLNGRILPKTDAVLSVSRLLSRARARLEVLAGRGTPASETMRQTLAFYRMVLDDPELRKGMEERIREGHSDPRDAMEAYFDDFIRGLGERGAYWADRRFDLYDLRVLIRESADGLPTPDASPWSEGTVVLADVLRTTDLLGLDFSRLRAVIAGFGGANSHAAIILKSAGIPLFLLERKLESAEDGDLIRVESDSGILRRNGRFWMRLPRVGTAPERAVFPNFEEVAVFPCLNMPEDGLTVSAEKLGGIGLVRTEIAVLAEKRFFTREEMIDRYLPLLEHFAGKPVFFRLWDFEPDKPAPEMTETKTGTAFLLAHPDRAMPQIEALVALSRSHPLGITLPMVREPGEIAIVRKWVEQALAGEDRPGPRIGAMVETLAYADHPEGFGAVDYLILGSNDLLAELFGRERQEDGFRPEWFRSPEFLRTAGRIAKAAETAGIPLFLCGEAANDPATVGALAEAGIRNFCPNPSSLGIFCR